MIRKRSYQDDTIIFRLIEQELVPLSHLSVQEMEQIRKELPRRLNRGITFVACRPDNAQVVGFIHVMLHGELLYIDLIAISSAHQGMRYGKNCWSMPNTTDDCVAASGLKLWWTKTISGGSIFICVINIKCCAT